MLTLRSGWRSVLWSDGAITETSGCNGRGDGWPGPGGLPGCSRLTGCEEAKQFFADVQAGRTQW